MSWVERAADRSEAAQRARDRRVRQATQIVDAGRNLIDRSPDSFTIQQLVDEAGIALQTFYRYFNGKDELLLAVLEEAIREAVEEIVTDAEALGDPATRLESYITAPLRQLSLDDYRRGRAITKEHYRLHQAYPGETAAATRPYLQLIERTIGEAQADGLFPTADASRDAWLINEIVRATYHHYAFAELGDDADEVIASLWSFCLRALGGSPRNGVATPLSTTRATRS